VKYFDHKYQKSSMEVNFIEHLQDCIKTGRNRKRRPDHLPRWANSYLSRGTLRTKTSVG